MVVWNSVALLALLGAFGVVARVLVQRVIIASIDRELDQRVAHLPRPMHGPPPRGLMSGPPGMPPGPPGPGGPGGPLGDMAPPGPDGEGPGGPRPRGFLPFGAQPQPGSSALDHPRLFDLRGQPVLAGSGDRPLDAAAIRVAAGGDEVFTTTVADGEPIRVLTAPVPGLLPVRAVAQVAYSLTEINRALASLTRALLLLAPVAVAAAALAGAYLTRRVLRPVSVMMVAAEQLGAGEFGGRLPVVGDDEFGGLARTFNGLLARQQTAYQRLERMAEQQRRFTADASHELKTPLTVIKGTASMALAGSPGEESYRQSLIEVDQAADTMSQLVQDLLLLARSDSGQLGRSRIELLLHDVLRCAVRRAARPHAAPIEVRMGDEPLTVCGVEDELIRLFANLLENATCYTPVEGRITVTSRRADSRVVVAIADTGIGIAPEHLQHLGERFFRVESARSRPDGGTGLGISICKGIAASHGGSIGFQSTPGRGTTVTVILPASS